MPVYLCSDSSSVGPPGLDRISVILAPLNYPSTPNFHQCLLELQFQLFVFPQGSYCSDYTQLLISSFLVLLSFHFFLFLPLLSSSWKSLSVLSLHRAHQRLSGRGVPLCSDSEEACAQVCCDEQTNLTVSCPLCGKQTWARSWGSWQAGSSVWGLGMGLEFGESPEYSKCPGQRDGGWQGAEGPGTAYK